VKLVHLVGFIIKKFVTMQGHMNVKYVAIHSLNRIVTESVVTLLSLITLTYCGK
jgi:hypothetical protein